MGIRKYLAPVLGEKLLHRTLRQFQRAAPCLWKAVILHPDADQDEMPAVENLHIEVPPQHMLGEENKLLSSCRLWDPIGKTVIVFGDVFLTDEAVNTIMATRSHKIEWFGRSGPGTKTGWPFAEVFALSFPYQRIPELIEAVEAAKAASRAEEIEVAKAWHAYRYLAGIPLTEGCVVGDHFTEIDDLTQDFDCPECYRRWQQAAGTM
jgi:hypothetical protein